MADLTKHRMYTRMGVNSTPTARTGSPTTWYWVPVFEDGVGFDSSAETQDINTEHKDRGVKYRIFTRRNHEQVTLDTPFFPANSKLLLDAAISLASGQEALPAYHTVESYWGDSSETGLSGSNEGIQCNGVLFSSLALNIDRTSPGPIELSLGAFINEYKALTTDANPDWPPLNPYDVRQTYIDVDLNETGFTGDNADVRTLSLTYDQNLEVDLFRPHATATLNGTWTRAYATIPTLELQFSLVVSDSTYPFLLDKSTLRTMQARIMGHSPSPSGSTTTTASATAGSAVAVSISDTTGFAANDYVLFDDGTNQAVGKITAVGTSSITIDTLDVNIGSGASVYNTAWEIKAHQLDIVSASRPRVAGNVRVVNVTAQAKLEVNKTTIITHKAYNDDNA